MSFIRGFSSPEPDEKKTFSRMDFPRSLLSSEDRASLDVFLGRQTRQPHYFIPALVGCNFGSTQFINKFAVAYFSLFFFFFFPFD